MHVIESRSSLARQHLQAAGLATVLAVSLGFMLAIFIMGVYGVCTLCISFTLAAVVVGELLHHTN